MAGTSGNVQGKVCTVKHNPTFCRIVQCAKTKRIFCVCAYQIVLIPIQKIKSARKVSKLKQFSFITVVDCGEPPNVTHARRLGKHFSENDEIFFVCDDCFYGGGSIVCQSTGEWTPAPTCSGNTIPGSWISVPFDILHF